MCPCRQTLRGASLHAIESFMMTEICIYLAHSVLIKLSPNRVTRLTVAHLSADVLQEVVRHLDTRDICALSRTCKLFRAVCSEAAPFLRLSLFPHQVCDIMYPGSSLRQRSSTLLSLYPRNTCCIHCSRNSHRPLMIDAEICTAVDARAGERGRFAARPNLEAISDKGRLAPVGECRFRRGPNI